MRSIAAILVAVGCAKAPADTDVGPAPCTATITSSWPADGATVARNAGPKLAFDGEASTADVVVLDADGAAVAGTTTIADGEITFVPDDLLPGRATYTWTATVCDGGATGTFVTGALDEPQDPASLVDNAYAFDLGSATWTSPEGGGDLFEQAFGGVFLVGVQAADAVTLDTILSAGTETESGNWQQDPCFATVDFEPADFANNPYFGLDADTLETSAQGQPVTIHHAHLSGGLDADGIVDGRFEGEIDMRDYREQFGSDGCASLEAFLGISCVACESDGEEQCVPLAAEDVRGDLVPGLRVVPNEDPQECDPDEG